MIDYGIISTKKVAYAERFVEITRALNVLADYYEPWTMACEIAFVSPPARAEALYVAVSSIKQWANGRHIRLALYQGSVWKWSVTGKRNADKEYVARIVHLHFPDLPTLPHHTTDAIAIGLHHHAMLNLQSKVGSVCKLHE